MKITKSQLRQIIKEELLKEAGRPHSMRSGRSMGDLDREAKMRETDFLSGQSDGQPDYPSSDIGYDDDMSQAHDEKEAAIMAWDSLSPKEQQEFLRNFRTLGRR